MEVNQATTADLCKRATAVSGIRQIPPDLTKQLIVEVAASDVGLGAVVSRVHGEPSIRTKLSPAERNYDIGNYVIGLREQVSPLLCIMITAT